ncbi:MAG: nucleotidyltransferase [Bacteroidetes bacterium SW_11_45_7]|nr:MAG: nucleotidyltransferase [Bacteroidetes bacterium SW_11_45_7]
MAKKYIREVICTYDVRRAFIYESYANGTNRKDSDIDVAIVLNTEDDILDVQVQLFQLRSDRELLIEPHPFRTSDFNESNPVASEILRTGIELTDQVVARSAYQGK